MGGVTVSDIDLDVANGNITGKEIQEKVQTLNNRKAIGKDEIANFMLKLGGIQVIKYLKYILNIIYTRGKLPDIWMKGILIPISKTKEMNLQVDKFRPICLLSNTAKTMEKIVKDRLYNISEKYGWIPNIQSGFVKKKSTLDNLIILQQEIHGAFKKHEHLVAIFLDIRKAYDCVDRKGLIKMLYGRGLRGKIFKYLKEFLGEDRTNVI